MSRAAAADRRPAWRNGAWSIELLQPTGSRTYATFRLGDAPVVAELQAHDVSQPGETLELAIDMNRAIIIDPASGEGPDMSIVERLVQERRCRITAPGSTVPDSLPDHLSLGSASEMRQ